MQSHRVTQGFTALGVDTRFRRFEIGEMLHDGTKIDGDWAVFYADTLLLAEQFEVDWQTLHTRTERR